jgi:gluconokinase
MGVSGSGKSTVGAELARRLGRTFADGDDFHPPSNRAKMSAGTPLTDDDRWPWLDTIAAYLKAEADADRPAVIACSALRRVYRDRIRSGGAPVVFVLLAGDHALLEARMIGRQGHFMKAGMLDSQLATLEPLLADEPGITIDNSAPLEQVVERAITELRSFGAV